ncbi:hypothetical protein ACQJBY_029487 [Aegilops geniculata]
MAAKNPTYFQSIPLQQEIQQKELRFHLYMFQHCEGQRYENQRVIAGDNLPNLFGTTAVHDWPIRDGSSLEANIVARAQGLHLGVGMVNRSWLFCFNIVFTDERFVGSSLKILGTLDGGSGDLAIVGGTGEFAFAQGVLTYESVKDDGGANVTRELPIRAMCLTFPKDFPKPVLVTKVGPWGGNGGKEFDIPEPVPQCLESVTIRSGVVIDSIAFSYVNQVGKKKSLGPWGGDGELTDMITFAPLEIVKEVSGTTGTYCGDTVVTSLTFVTNVRTYGPFGKPNGTAFSVPLTDTNVVGFFVRAGRLVNAIGVYARPFVQNY